jgi:hypothetical protein
MTISRTHESQLIDPGQDVELLIVFSAQLEPIHLWIHPESAAFFEPEGSIDEVPPEDIERWCGGDPTQYAQAGGPPYRGMVVKTRNVSSEPRRWRGELVLAPKLEQAQRELGQVLERHLRSEHDGKLRN